MSSQDNLSVDLVNKRSINSKKVVKKINEKNGPSNDDIETTASQVLGSKTGSINNLQGSKLGSINNLQGSKLGSINNLQGSKLGSINNLQGSKLGSINNLQGSKLGSKNNLQGRKFGNRNNIIGSNNNIDHNDENSVRDSNIINYKVGQVSTMTSDDIEKILGDKERLLGELYTSELENDRLIEENQILKEKIDEQKQTISKLLISNNENGITIPSTSQNNDSVNNYENNEEKLYKKIESLEDANEQLKGQNEELLNVIQNSEEEIERLGTELRSVKSSSKVELSKTKIENNKLKSSIEELENKIESMVSLEKENEILKSSLETLERKNDSLVKIERENSKIRSSLGSIDDKDRIIDTLQNDNQELKLSLESVKDEIIKINQKDKEIELLQRENDILRHENEELILTNNKLQTTVNELTVNMKQAEELTQDDIKVISTDQSNTNIKINSHSSISSPNGTIKEEVNPSTKEEIADNISNISGSKNFSVCSSSISLLKCSVPELIKEIKDLKKCVYYINKQKKDLEKKLQEALSNNNNKEQKSDDNCPPINNNPNENSINENINPSLSEEQNTNNGQNSINEDVNNNNKAYTLQELQGIIEGIDKEIINTRKIKEQFNEQENSIIDLKRELLKYGKNKEERVRNIGRVLNNNFTNNMESMNNMDSNININESNSERNESNNKLNTLNEESDSIDNIYFKVKLHDDKLKLHSQLSNAKKTIHQLKKLCDGLSTELENYRNNNESEYSTSFSIDVQNNHPSRTSKRHHSHSRNRTYDKRSLSLGRNFGKTNTISSTNSNSNSTSKNNSNYNIYINDNTSSTTSNTNGNISISGSGTSSSNKNSNSIYDSMSYYSGSHGYTENTSLISGTSLTPSSISKEKSNYGRSDRSKSCTNKYYDNKTSDYMMLVNDRDKEKKNRLNRDLNSLHKKFQDLLKSYQNIKSEQDAISNELINTSNYSTNDIPLNKKEHHHSHSCSRHRKPYEKYDSTSTRGRSQSPCKRKSLSNEKDNISNGHLRSCSTHTNGIKVEVYT
ncbi:hypothetical protein H8356DRAFT_1288164 [Neocallimastix lanati (nom. inval.)]|jgi:DNA repair exonuclease SbcCD ATPase subunit|uniref:Uncharacterized protein n=1 Tax=Neocallimastix californiae TaxID=1754190 RepID=A0A1Y2EQB3_9FUNG|nr:hypothetical protein H8356DRAFT_1288164 [Neocallimastix sp. JGI-2020a]ORY73484.1 hypothetical protein LY90DRAFT_666574 [Neocallimastix californiae]|eukprot:ORY73484.1 hypothetical protein LY90DRAFT_666574 [Neocallimastix californiae]